MRFIGDFHIHSHYSRATSKQLTPENLDLWGRRKGIAVVGTGDFTHPGWVAELREALVPAEDGLFAVKAEQRIEDEGGSGAVVVRPGGGAVLGPAHTGARFGTAASPTPDLRGPDGTAPPAATRFVLTAEISTIYKYDGKVRKVHHVIFAPHFDAVTRIQEKIEHLGGNIRSDGRPILGLDSRDLLELCLEADDDIFFVPAHIWTPWFSTLGSKSGFDSIRECYRDLSDHISAVETGLSSDPPMNWMCSFLDEYTLVSNSDAHSPEKLGREANLFDTGLSYGEIVTAMKDGAPAGFRGTIEFFPQEGKYHFDGHRKCKVAWDPLETLRYGGLCPVCGRPVTEGVLNRVAQLADRSDVHERRRRDPFFSLIPVKELLAEIEGVGAGSKRVQARYAETLRKLGPELDILLYRGIDEIEEAAGEALAAAVERMRRRQVRATAGYDGEYGTIRIWDGDDSPPRDDGAARSLFAAGEAERGRDGSHPAGAGPGRHQATAPPPLELVEFDLVAFQERRREAAHFGATPTNATSADPFPIAPPASGRDETAAEDPPVADKEGPRGKAPSPGPVTLNAEQRAAVEYSGGPSLIVAGPGTGKTRTVVEKIRHLVANGARPGAIIAVTFANKAAGELRERLTPAGVPAGPALAGSGVTRRGAGETIAAAPATGTAVATGPGSETPPADGPVGVFTFHSLGLGILRSHLQMVGRTEGFLILDDDEKAALLTSGGSLSSAERSVLIEFAGRIKSGAVPVPDETDPDHSRFRAYQSILQTYNAFDYDDLVYLPVRLFQKRPDIATTLRRSIRHLVIDEYQDINPIQYALVRALSDGVEVCAVGDPHQSIYGFRGSSPRFIEHFTADFRGARRFPLSRSYRCPGSVLTASAQVLDDEIEALLGHESEAKITVLKTPTAAFEAEQIARDIEVRTGGVGFFSFDSGVTDSAGTDDSGAASFSDIAVLCRTAMQMAPLERALRDHRIPFRTIQTDTLFRAEPYRSFLNFLRLLLQRDRGSETPITKVPFASMEGIDPDRLAGIPVPATRDEAVRLFLALRTSDDAAEAAGDPPAGGDGLEELPREIARFWRDTDDAATFVERARLGSGLDRYDSRMQTVSLMTMHAAKGLEFDVVYIPGCEDGLVPYTLSGARRPDARLPGAGDAVETDLAEERRLLYVAMTRAKSALILSWAQRRTIFGRTRERTESPFLSAIERALLERRTPEVERTPRRNDDQLALFE